MKIKPTKRLFIIGGAALAAVLAVVIIVIAAGAGGGEAGNTLQTVPVTRGDLSVMVTSTGTISARNTVDVGTQVSGTIKKLYADFNQHVRAGQLLAELDPTLLDLAVQSATADQMKATAQYEFTLKDWNNNVLLHDKNLIADFDLETSRVGKDAAYATKLSADAALSRAKVNQAYAVIRSPIDGVILNRAVEEGQTVAASLSAPTLFTIAEDLSSIQITTYVAESDIGSIKPGQKATFTVATFGADTFSGTVDIIHFQSQTIQNVVNYVVMVNANNPGSRLMPGMTATVNFVIDERKDAWLVPNAALSFRPTPEMLKEFQADNPERRPSGNRQRNSEGTAVASAPTDSKVSDPPAAPRNAAVLWTVDANGKIKPLRVTIGLSDGQKTEVIADGLSAGLKCYTNQAVKKTTPSAGFQGPRRLF